MKRVEALEKLKNVRTIRESGLTKDEIVSALEGVSYSETMNDQSQVVAELRSQLQERDAQIANLRDSLKRQRAELKKLRNGVD